MENIGRAVERLLTDETLTADVDDAAAKALLRWGQEQLKAGRPEEQVRPAIKALARLVGKRASLDPAAARARLEAAGLAADETALAGLWAEKLPEGTWAERLLQTLSAAPPPPPPVTPPPSSADSCQTVPPPPASSAFPFTPLPIPPSPAPPAPPAVGRGEATAGSRGEETGAPPWWQRFLFWKKRS